MRQLHAEVVSSSFSSKLSFAKYVVPAALYALYNNLTYVGLSKFSPGTYFVLMQLRIVVTGIVATLVLKKRYNLTQWCGLIVVMVGAMLKDRQGLVDLVFVSGDSPEQVAGYTVVLAQILLSVFAGVVTEILMKSTTNSAEEKTTTKETSTHVHNMIMYFHSIWVLVLGGIVSGSDFSFGRIFFFSGLPLVIALNGALMGITTGFFLKHLSSVLKSIASAIELWVTLVASSVVFGYPFGLWDFAGVLVLTGGVAVYSLGSRQPAKITI